MNTLSSTVTTDASQPVPAMSVERFGHLVGLIYDAASDTANWSRCLEELRRAFDANFVSLIVRPGTAHDLGFIVSAAGVRYVFESNPALLALSPFAHLRPGKVVTQADIVSPAEWRASQYYREWCAPHGVHHVLAVDVDVRDGGVYGFRATRSEAAPAFGADEVVLCERLLPHLRRALSMHASLNQHRQVHSLYRNAMGQLMVGVILLDENARVLESNPMADAILKLGDGLSVSGNRLCAAYPDDNRKLQQLIQKTLKTQAPATPAAPVEAIPVSRGSGRAAWGVVIQSISPDQWTEGKHRPCVAVFVRDPEIRSEPPMRLVQQLFQLTPAETALAIQLANGLSLDEAAEALDIRRNTARAHLRSIFSKTGVRRQTELVRIFLNSVVLLGAGD